MTSTSKLLFDENTGGPFVGAFRAVAAMDRRHPVEIAHTIERFGKSAQDADWIPKIKDEGWLLISEDRGRNSAAGDRLPQLCHQHAITHILVLPALLKRGGQFEKMRALLAVWPELHLCAQGAPGVRARLKYSGASCTSFKLEIV